MSPPLSLPFPPPPSHPDWSQIGSNLWVLITAGLREPQLGDEARAAPIRVGSLVNLDGSNGGSRPGTAEAASEFDYYLEKKKGTWRAADSSPVAAARPDYSSDLIRARQPQRHHKRHSSPPRSVCPGSGFCFFPISPCV